MTLKRLRLRNLLFHWRGNTAVFLGVVVGSAVLTGALLVGDSLRGSLRQRAVRQLGWVEQALIAPRFFRQGLAGDVAMSGAAERVCPALVLQGTIVVRGKGGEGAIRRQLRGVTVLGVDAAFWSAFGKDEEPTSGDSAILNSTLGQRLEVAEGDKVSLRLQKPSAIPRETLLGRRDEESAFQDWTLSVANVLSADDAADPFTLRPQLEEPRTAFVPLGALQKQLDLEGRCNAILVGGVHSPLDGPLRSHLLLEDWGLVLLGPQERVEHLVKQRQWRDKLAGAIVKTIHPGGKSRLTRTEMEDFYQKHRYYLSLESKQLLLEPFIAEAALEAAKASHLRAAPTLIYLANSIRAGDKDVPYSLVAALDPAQAPPLGPFLPKGIEKLADDEIVLADWKESPLPRDDSEKVTLTYFPPTHQGEWREDSKTFRLAGMIPLRGVAADPDLTPAFPGITDKLSITDWDPPFPYDNKRIKERDEDYWLKYRTTPKAYVNLATGQRLWGNRFGRLTSIRLAPGQGSELSDARTAFEKELRERLDPARGGLVFNPVREQAIAASSGGMDFAQLFLGFSFFLIAASLLLVGLLFRLNIDRRAEEIGLLMAVGFRRAAVRRLLVGEGAVIAAAGAVVGACLAMVYARLLLRLLAALWPGGAMRSILQPHFEPLSVAMGAGAAFLVAEFTIVWAVFSLGRVAPSALLAGQVPGEGEKLGRRRRRWSWWIAAGSLLGGFILLPISGRIADHEMRASAFFGSGMLLLIGCLATLSGWMRSTRTRAVEGNGWWSVARLGIRNAARHPGRSLLTAGLLAAAAFLLVAVEAFRRRVDAHEAVAQANGGFDLVAETDLPLFRDLNSKEGREEIRNKLERIYQGESLAANEVKRRAEEATALLEQVKVVPFRVHAGDDASCLNLYQPLRPRLLGVPAAFIESQRGGFRFAATSARSEGERSNPWTLLMPQESEVPAFGEKNTVEWMLHTSLGGQVTLPPDHRLRIDGLLSDSVFQSSLLVSEPNFLRMYPGHEGYNFFLIHAPEGKEDEVRRVLELAYGDRGMQVTPTVERLNAYLAVENTYLSTFQALGGLGLLLGSLGLAVVLLRGVWERRGELALLRALGFRRSLLGWLILAENAFLLLVGLLAGTASALLAVSPHLLGGAGSIPWTNLLALLAGVVLVGLIAGALATASTLRAPLILALRRE
jgi:putative ABC transport system permease protein